MRRMLLAGAALVAAAVCLRSKPAPPAAGAARENFLAGVEALVDRDDDAAARDFARCLDGAEKGSQQEADCRLFSGMLRARLAAKEPVPDDNGEVRRAYVERPELPRPKDAPFKAQQSYLEGVIYYQKGDYATARARWAACAAQDAECRAGLDRVDSL